VTDTYTKLFSSITESTIWSEPAGTRLVWITLLAKCNRHGEVFGSVPGLARLANVTLDECVKALDTFRSPDRWSRTPDNDGRRIEDIEGGWRLLNHAKFDRMRSEAEAAERERERKRQWDREHRPSGHARAKQSDDSPTTVRHGSDEVRAPTNTNSNSKEQELKSTARQAERFADWWAVYPKKVKRKDAEALWARRKFDAIADQLIADVLNRTANDDGWQRGYVPDPTTYLNQERWNDEVRAAPTARAGPPAAPGKQMQGLMALEEMKRGLVRTGSSDGVAAVGMPLLERDPRR